MPESLLSSVKLLKSLETLFPFHLITSKDGHIISCGTSLQKWVNPDEHFDELFHESWQSTLISRHAGQTSEAYVRLTCRRLPLKLHGVFQQSPDSEEILLLAYPLFQSTEDLEHFLESPVEFGPLDPVHIYIPFLADRDKTIGKLKEELTELQAEKNAYQKLAHIMEETSNATIIIDNIGKIEWVNKSFLKIFDFTSSEVIGVDIRTVFTSILGNVPYYASLSAAIETGAEYHQKVKCKSKKGVVVDLKIRLQSVYHTNKNLAYQFVTIENITEQQKMEAVLRRSELLWQYALEGSGDGIWMADLHDATSILEFTFFSSYKKLLGYQPSDEFTEETLRKHISVEHYNEFIEAVLTTSKMQPFISYSCEAIDARGRRRYLLTRAKAIDFHENNAAAKIIGTITDVSKIRHLEEESAAGINRLKQVLTNLRTGILLEDVSGSTVCVNNEFCRVFNIPADPKSLEGINWTNTSEPVLKLVSDRASFLSHVNRLREERKLDVGNHLKLSDGRILSVDYIPISDGRGIFGHLWQCTDATDEAVFTRKNEEQKQFYETILHELPASINIFSPAYKYLFVNKYSINNDALRAWIIGRDDFEYYRHVERDRSKAMERRALFMQAVNQQQPIKYVDIVRDADSQQYFLHIFYPYVVDGKVKLVIECCTDITEQKIEELSLIRERARIKDLIDVINDGIFLCDHEGDITYYNASFAKLTGIVPGDSPINVLQLLEDSDAWMFRKKLREIRDAHDAASGIAKIREKNTFVDYFITHSPSGNETSEIIGRFSDVTNQVYKEKTLNELVEKEKELNDLKTRFIRITSHELRTPLTSILSNMEILQLLFEKDRMDPTLANKYEDYIERVVKEVYRMNNLLADLVVVGRIEDGKELFDFSEDNFEAFLGEIIEDLFWPYSDGRTLQYELINPEELQSVAFCKRMFRHCIVNILSNAFKYSTGKPAPIMRVHAGRETVVIEVQDFGIGIQESEIAKVTMSFFRGSNVGNTFGTGIGLMLTDYIVKAHDGSLTIKSKLNTGTTVTIIIPKNKTVN